MCVLTTEEEARLAIQKIRIKKKTKTTKKETLYMCVCTDNWGGSQARHSQCPASLPGRARRSATNWKPWICLRRKRQRLPAAENLRNLEALVYDVCSCMLTHADKGYLQRRTSVTLIHQRMTYADVCWHMLTNITCSGEPVYTVKGNVTISETANMQGKSKVDSCRRQPF